MLVDPHDQQSIADALLKLVSEKNLWAKCRESGLKNIHLFSWPEHCKTYLARITSCKQRQPKWQGIDKTDEDTGSDSPGDSLRDINDLSLSFKISLDGEKNEGLGLAYALKGQEQRSLDGRQQINSVPLRRGESMEKPENNKFPALRRRKCIFFMALDCDASADILKISKLIIEAGKNDIDPQSIGFVFSTALNMSEVNSLLDKGGLTSSNFDAIICNSGSEIYYPSLNPDAKSPESAYLVDSDYYPHIDYRWGGGDSLRNTLVRWATSINEKSKDNNTPVITEIDSGSDHCHAFEVNDPTTVCYILRCIFWLHHFMIHIICINHILHFSLLYCTGPSVQGT